MSQLTAVEIVATVHSGEQTPLDTVRAALERAGNIGQLDAFVELFTDEAIAAATELGKRSDLASLPLAGLPILIKDCIPVAGHPMRIGSLATSPEPQSDDHEIVKRLKHAGAIVIGNTQVPELCIFGTTDSPYGTTRNPWNTQFSTGGSSGGTAAAVASGVVPVAHGTDGMGSIRIPSANCGLFGIKPGLGLVPADMGYDSWGHMSENGPLATTVEDAALMLSVLAAEPALADVTEPQAPLRIAIASNTPSFLVRLSKPWATALDNAADTLREAGHTVEIVPFGYPLNILPLLARWFVGTASDARELDINALAPRSRRHVKMGHLATKLGWVKEKTRKEKAAAAHEFFKNYDVLVTPMLAASAPPAVEWHKRSWIANLWSNLMYAPFAAHWNMLGWPAAAVPVGSDEENGLPTAVQLVAEPGGEATLLGLAAQIQRLRPWERTAPNFR